METERNLSSILAERTETSISERVCSALRIAIINHDFLPGERMVEAKLAENLGVSITPVRYAFTQLAKEGLIEVFPYRGTMVRVLTPKFVRDFASVRADLEVAAANMAFHHFSQKDLDLLQQYTEQLANRSTYHSIYESSFADTQFHDVFFRRSENELLIEIWEMLRVRMQLITSYNKSRIPPELQENRHKIILEDLYRKDKEKLLADIRSHGMLLYYDAVHVSSCSNSSAEKSGSTEPSADLS